MKVMEDGSIQEHPPVKRHQVPAPRIQPSNEKPAGKRGPLIAIKFGGVVGKQTLLGIFAVGSLAAIAWRAPPDQVPIIAIGAVVIVLVIAVLNFIFADRHPVEATLIPQSEYRRGTGAPGGGK